MIKTKTAMKIKFLLTGKECALSLGTLSYESVQKTLRKMAKLKNLNVFLNMTSNVFKSHERDWVSNRKSI